MPSHIQLKRDNPFCIFCGGTAPTTSVEHMPSRGLFELKQRPMGLEFASCQGCQDSTRREELAIAMFSRNYPDPPSREARKENRKIIRETGRRFPGLFQEMHIDQLAVLRELGEAAKNLPTWNFIGMGPIAKAIIQKFGRKLAIALHFELTKEIVPLGAGLIVYPYSNYQAIIEGMPTELMEALGAEKALVMGQQHSWGTFSYQSAKLSDQPTSIHMAYFRQSFALMLAVFPNIFDVPPVMMPDLAVH
jgi:hypothetical protein